ncbi:MAG: J domain-containing protein [Pirellulaceae bacterium]
MGIATPLYNTSNAVKPTKLTIRARNMTDDYYQVLGVPRNASVEQIQKAYRELARKNHPDLNPDDRLAKENFQKIQTAYDTLRDVEKRQRYDQFGSDFERMGEGGAGGQGFDFDQVFRQGTGGTGEMPAGFEDLFRQFSGGAGRSGPTSRRQPRGGADLNQKIRIPFATAVTGGKSQFTVPRPDGKEETITVSIPVGVRDGQKIRLRGKGEPSAGGKSGDLLLTVHVAEHPCFERHGDDLELNLPIGVEEAILGATIDVPTPHGTAQLEIPSGTSSGKRLCLKDHGIHAKAGKGHLFVTVQVHVPDKIDEQSEQWLKEFAQRNPLNLRTEIQW